MRNKFPNLNIGASAVITQFKWMSTRQWTRFLTASNVAQNSAGIATKPGMTTTLESPAKNWLLDWRKTGSCEFHYHFCLWIWITTAIILNREKELNEAIIRKCPRCGIVFMKSEGKMEWGYTIKQILIIKKHIPGCNKMTCRCGMTQCYICRKSNIDYTHFCQWVTILNLIFDFNNEFG